MGKSPNPTDDGKCKCCNCEEILTDEAVLKFTKNTWGSGQCLFVSGLMKSKKNYFNNNI